MRWIVKILVLAFIVGGCASKDVPGVYQALGHLKTRKVAVLPFDNISGRRAAGKIAANVFVTELFRSGRFQVEEPGNIIQFMIHERIRTIGEMELEKIRLLGRRFGIDAIIVGVVEEFDDGIKGGLDPLPSISISARMLDTKSGRIIWSAQNAGKGNDYVVVFDSGEVRSIITLTRKVIGEMIRTIE